jgi:hypothetical protein
MTKLQQNRIKKNKKRLLVKISKEIDALAETYERWNNRIDIESDKEIQCTNYDQEEYDVFCESLTEFHKNVCGILGYHSVHEQMEAIKKVMNDFGHEGCL